MIIKSHVRGGYRSAAEYMKDQGLNEKIRLIEISDPDAKNLDEAFHNMWIVASNTRCTKPLHHISINPYKDERLTRKQVLKIAERCEEKYGYQMFHHQRVIVEHVKDGRQHFHIIWNRVSLVTGRPVWPGEHWNKSKQAAREMEIELGLKRPTPKRTKRTKQQFNRSSRSSRMSGNNKTLHAKPSMSQLLPPRSFVPTKPSAPRPAYQRPMPAMRGRRKKADENIPDTEKLPFHRPEWDSSEIIAWAFENGRADILAQFGIYLSPDHFEP